MRLLYVCSDHGITPSGTKGAAIHVRAITRALCEAGHEVTIVSPRGDAGPAHPARGLPPADLDDTEETIRGLRQWLIERGLGTGIAGEFRALTYQAAAGARVRAALADRPPDAVLERASLFGHLGMDLASFFGVPLIVEINALLTEEARCYRSLHLTDLAADIEQRLLQRADAVMPVSQELAARLTRSTWTSTTASRT